jgi:hypothetical protein
LLFLIIELELALARVDLAMTLARDEKYVIYIIFDENESFDIKSKYFFSYDEAQTLYEQAIATFEKQFGPHSQYVANYAFSMAQMFVSQQKWEVCATLNDDSMSNI